VLAAVTIFWSCTSTTVESNPVASVELTPPTSSVRAGGTVTLVAKPKDAAGNAVDVRVIAWSSSNKTVATVSPTGVVTTLSPGDARIAASAMGKSATATITVTAREVASVVVTPATVSMRVGVSAPLQAQTLDADGGVLTGRTVNWTSSNTAVATVSAQGIVSALSTGAATITATSEGRGGQAAVTVTLPPVQTVVVSPAQDTLGVGTERLHTAVLRDASGNVLTGRALAWSSNNVAVATVSSTGVVSGLGPGTATISATSEGRVGTAIVVVLARLAGTVTLTPGSNTLIVGSTQQLTTQITDSLGNLLTGRPVSYSSDASTVASVSASGLITALTPGSARITASSEGKSGTATVEVIPVPVGSVQLTPASATMLVNGTQQLTAVARSAAGTILTGRSTTFTSGAPSVASVNSNGLVTALSPGLALVLASVDGVTATSTITVALPTIASMTVTPVDPSIAILASVQLTATPRDAGGAAIAGRTITWSSADESIAFVSSSGLVVGFKAGSVRITATAEGVSASTLVTVR
jgi:uncharacterized protein YjdB